MIQWRNVQKWCLGANDEFGTCFWAMCGNMIALLGKGVMSDGEIENAARQMTGFDPYVQATDRGENLDAGFQWIQTNGWPGDPTLKISSFRPINQNEVYETIERTGFAPTWLMLPKLADGSDYDFSDSALARGAPGVDAHAILPVEEYTTGVTFITWAQPQHVSLAWAQRYFRGSFAVEWKDIS